MINLKEIVRDNIQNLKPYSSARDEYSSNEGIFLDANENPFGLYNRYPDPYQNKLKERISEIKSIAKENIFIGNGSDEIIDLTFRIFCNPGKDKALMFTPGYGMYEVSANINDVEIIKEPLNEHFQINIDNIKQTIVDPHLKSIFICSPNNPTGNLMNNEDVIFILENFKGIVFLDEAYIDFTEEESFIHKVKQYNNLIVSQTLSKSWALAGSRIGTAFAHREIIDLLNKCKPPYNVSSINQDIAHTILKNEFEFNKKIEFIINERKRMQKELTKIKSIQKIYPSDANFLFVECTDADKIYKALLERKIIIRNRSQLVNNCVRITIGTKDENKLVLKTLKEIEA
jgi:histidinol-phosphate aminotransferase